MTAAIAAMIAAIAAMMIAAKCSVVQLQGTNGQGWSRYGGPPYGARKAIPPYRQA
jgi:hypothetical protein